MNELALFAGAGGGLLASSIVGNTIVCAVERDEYCIEVLCQRQNDRIIPPFPIWDDICTFDGGDGKELWTWFLEDSPVKRSLVQQEVEILLKKIYGTKCVGLLERWSLEQSLLKTYPKKPYYTHETTCFTWDIDVNISNFQRETLVQTMNGTDIGYLHTPTTMANFAAPSMQKHRGCRNFVTAFGKPSPTNFEYLMGWPSGWTDLKPLETDKFLLWRQAHGLCCTKDVSEMANLTK